MSDAGSHVGAAGSLRPNAFLDALPRGRLAENVMHFVRILRAAGLPVGPAKVLDALAAVDAIGLDNRDDFRAALAAVLVSRREHQPVFEQAFALFWRNPQLLERMLAALLPKVEGRAGAPDELPARLAQAMLPPPREAQETGDDETELDAAFSFSAREVLQHKDFASMTGDELAQAKALLRAMKLPLPRMRVRRTAAASRGHVIDLRATLRRSIGAGGTLTWRRHQSAPGPFDRLYEASILPATSCA